MKKLLIYSTVVAALASMMIAALSPQVNAQTPRDSITLSPVDKHYEIDAGSSIEDTVTVVNDGETDYTVTVYARPYSVTNEAYTPEFNKTKDNTDVYQWLQFPATSYSVKAGESKVIPFTMNVPKTAKPGGHYGVVFVETQPKRDDQGTSVRRNKRVGSIIYATVKGDFTKKGSIADVATKFWQVAPPLVSTARVTNDGTTDFSDIAKLTVFDIFGRKKYEAERPYPVLPQTTRKISLEWPSANWFGVYKVNIQHSFLDTKEDRTSYVLLMPRYVPFIIVAVVVSGLAYALLRRKRRS